MFLTVNDEHYEHRGDGSVDALLSEFGANPKHSALTVNGEIVCSKDWKNFNLTDGDSVEILTFVGGG